MFSLKHIMACLNQFYIMWIDYRIVLLIDGIYVPHSYCCIVWGTMVLLSAIQSISVVLVACFCL